MKKSLIATVLISVSSLAFGQEGKIVSKAGVYKYDLEAEIPGYRDYQFFDMVILDKQGQEYTYSEGNFNQAKWSNTANVDIYKPLGIASSIKWSSSKSDFFLQIIQDSTVGQTDELVKFASRNTRAVLHAYKISMRQHYTVRVFDARHGNKLVKEFSLDYEAKTYWPRAVSQRFFGYVSPDELEKNYAAARKNSNYFSHQINVGLIDDALTHKIGHELDLLFFGGEEKLAYRIYEFKTKNGSFDALKSATVSLHDAIRELKKSQKNSLEIVKLNLYKAQEIYQKYTDNVYMDLLIDKKLQTEYLKCINANLLLTGNLLSTIKV